MVLRHLILCGMGLLALAPSSAGACGWPNCLGSVGPVGWWIPGQLGTQDHIPYFAKHPPVYYSHPVARTYGSLPYPYLPEPMPRPAVTPEILVVRNRYVVSETSYSAPGVPVPLRVINPYVQEGDGPSLPEEDE